MQALTVHFCYLTGFSSLGQNLSDEFGDVTATSTLVCLAHSVSDCVSPVCKHANRRLKGLF